MPTRLWSSSAEKMAAELPALYATLRSAAPQGWHSGRPLSLRREAGDLRLSLYTTNFGDKTAFDSDFSVQVSHRWFDGPREEEITRRLLGEAEDEQAQSDVASLSLAWGHLGTSFRELVQGVVYQELIEKVAAMIKQHYVRSVEERAGLLLDRRLLNPDLGLLQLMGTSHARLRAREAAARLETEVKVGSLYARMVATAAKSLGVGCRDSDGGSYDQDALLRGSLDPWWSVARGMAVLRADAGLRRELLLTDLIAQVALAASEEGVAARGGYSTPRAVLRGLDREFRKLPGTGFATR